MADRWCAHCDLDRSRRTNGLCDACNTYQTRTGTLPPPKLIRRRVERAIEHDHLKAAGW